MATTLHKSVTEMLQERTQKKVHIQIEASQLKETVSTFIF